VLIPIGATTPADMVLAINTIIGVPWRFVAIVGILLMPVWRLASEHREH
jgi:hypothetical protein